MDVDDGEQLQLSGNALDALQSFYQERDASAKTFEDLKAQAECDFDDGNLSIEAFAEDWNASQFWYTDETADALARELLEGSTSSTRIAVLSAPSVFIRLKKMVNSMSAPDRPDVRLLEFDERFNVFKEFVQYDFAQPTRLPVEMKGQFDRIICDPPFLSDECQTKVALTVRWLATSWQLPSEVCLTICTGERMSSLILKLYAKLGVRATTFMPQHTRGLSNEFACFANKETASWKFADP